MAEFLIELLCEEIPARMQARGASELGRLFAEAMAARGVAAVAETFVTPRRLALIARALPAHTEPTREERRGPRADAPEGAISGFLKSAGVARDALDARDDAKGRFLYAVIEKPGRAIADVLADAVPEAVGKLAWPRSMRWGAASVSMDSPRWVRPLSGVVALLDDAIVPMTILGLEAGDTTRGHRFMSHAPVTIASVRTYASQLRDVHVILDAAERARMIEAGARAAAAAHGLVLIEDAGLVADNAGLTEWPVALLGRFDPAFLEVPREAIQLTMRVNQKYFACVDAGGALAPAFVCVANIAAADGGAGIVEGNRRVLAARLSDARFFWEQDRAKPLEAYLPGLERIVFHEKLGTMRDKAERVARLARWLAESGAVPGADPDLAERAGRLAKADLVTAMVGEFPELQGVMGGHYALASGEDPAVAAAVRDHYRPVGPSDAVPVEPVSVAVALADKLDTLATFFFEELKPTGSSDPFALRRAGLGVLSVLITSGIRVRISDAIQCSLAIYVGVKIGREQSTKLEGVFAGLMAADLEIPVGQVAELEQSFVDRTTSEEAVERLFGEPTLRTFRELNAFLADRLKVQQREAGVRHDLIDAVFALGNEDDIVRLLARVHALQAFITTPDGANLLAAYKRAANILAIEAKRDNVERFGAPSPSLAPLAFPSPRRGEGGRSDATTLPPAGGGTAAQPQGEGSGTSEQVLAAVLATVTAEATAAVAAEDFTAAMAALAQLRGPIDAFFAATMVNDADPGVRLGNLALLQRFVDAVNTIADFSRIEG